MRKLLKRLFITNVKAGKTTGVRMFNHNERLEAARCIFCDQVFTLNKVRPVVVQSNPADKNPENVFGCEACCKDMGETQERS